VAGAARLRPAEGRVTRRRGAAGAAPGAPCGAGADAELPGAGAAGGLGAGLAALGAELVPGAEWLLDALGFDERLAEARLVVTGEGRVDASTREGKAPLAVAARARAAGVRCVVFGGVVDAPLPGVETVALSGDPAAAAADLRALGRDVVAQSN
jgi:glycerate kinase